MLWFNLLSDQTTRKSKPHSGWQEKSAIGACNERHPQSQYSVTRKRAVTGFFSGRCSIFLLSCPSPPLIRTYCPLSRKSNTLSAKWLLSRKGYNPFGETSAFDPRLSRYPQNDFVKCVLPQGSIVWKNNRRAKLVCERITRTERGIGWEIVGWKWTAGMCNRIGLGIEKPILARRMGLFR